MRVLLSMLCEFRLPKALGPMVLAVALSAAVAGSASANMYVCKDRNGRTWFTNVKKKGHRCRLAMAFAEPAPDAAAPPSRKTGKFRPQSPGTAAALPRPVTDGSTLAQRQALYDAYIAEAAARYRLPTAFIKAVMRIESRFKYNAVSAAGAQGLMQLMPRTGKAMGVTDAFDPRQNIFGGARLLRYLANKHGGDMVRVLSAYHAGSGAVKEKGGIPYETTEGYVRAVLKQYYGYKAASEPRAANP